MDFQLLEIQVHEKLQAGDLKKHDFSFMGDKWRIATRDEHSLGIKFTIKPSILIDSGFLAKC